MARLGQEGIEVRHLKKCTTQQGGRCNCRRSYRGYVWNKTTGLPARGPWVKSLADAKGWRVDALNAIAAGRFNRTRSEAVRVVAERLIEGMKDGTVQTRSGTRYKPSVIRSYRSSLHLHVLPTLGDRDFGHLRRGEIQEMVDRLTLEHSPSTVRNAIMPLRAMYRHALARDQVAMNPTQGLQMPAVSGSRERVAGPTEAASIIEALTGVERAIWAAAFYAGLRLGELRALRIEDVDLAKGLIHIEASWDQVEGRTKPKSAAGRRRVPITPQLRDELARWGEERPWDAGLVFGRGPDQPFAPSTAYSRAAKAWKAASCERIALHECRHTFASFMIAAGANAKTLCTIMGHSTITQTFDRYGHLFPGGEEEAGELLGAYLNEAGGAG